MIKLRRLLRAVVHATIIALGAISMTAAQGLPGGATSLNETHGDWTVTCRAAEGAVRCAMTQIQVRGENRERVLAIELTATEADEAVSGVLVLPFGLSLEDGIRLSIDESAELDPRRFSTCLPGGCLVSLSFDGNAFAMLRAGTTMTVSAIASGSAQEATFTISLAGFASGLNRLGQLSE